MQIVVLDDVELSESQKLRLSEFGDVRWYTDNPSTSAEARARLEGCEVAILGWTSVDAALLADLPSLRMISVWATGYNYVDVSAAAARGIVVTNVPSYAGVAVAEYTLGLMISLARHLPEAQRSVQEGQCSWHPFKGVELRGRTLGVVGTGNIGGSVARLGKAFGMNVLATSGTMNPSRASELGLSYAALPELLPVCDFVSLHLPLSASTRGLIGADELDLMRNGSYLINTTRAEIVDQNALKDALRAGRLTGAALDEAHLPDDELVRMSNVIVMPHMGFYTAEALVRKGDICINNVAAFLADRPVNVVC
jgi:phosphoglycerate dehydrogenase-like enzyme